MFDLEKKASEYYDLNIEIIMSEKDENDFKNSDVCWLCDKKFLECQKIKMIEHCVCKIVKILSVKK